MKDLLKNLGLIAVVAGVIIVSIAVFNETQTNAKMAVSLVLVIVGLIAHIILNKYID